MVGIDAAWKSASGAAVDRAAGIGVGTTFLAGLVGVRLWAVGSLSEWDAWIATVSGWGEIAVLLALLGVIAVATALAGVLAWCTLPALRVLEGYWPPALAPLRRRLVATQERKKREDRAVRDDLAARASKGVELTDEEAHRFAVLDAATHHRPRDGRLMPTRLGNILRASEDRPRQRYGLDTVILWPRLWLVLPGDATKSLASARADLDGAVSGALWGLLFAVLGPIVALAGTASEGLRPAATALAAGVLTSVVSVRIVAPRKATTYADLLDSAFDLYRFALYDQARWPVPVGPEEEVAAGAALTRFLWRGQAPTGLAYEHD